MANKPPKSKRLITINIEEDMLAVIDEEKSRADKSRTEIIREMLKPAISDINSKDERPVIIAVTSFKGGVGKTTTSANLGYCLAEMGKKTLLIDLDGQGSLSQYIGNDDPEGVEPSIADVMITARNGKRASLEDVLQHTKYDNLDIIPSSIAFNDADSKIRQEMAKDDVNMRLKNAIDVLNETIKYDYIIIDCPPSLGLTVTNAILALEAGSKSSFVIIPIFPSGFSLRGLQDTVNMIKQSAMERRLPSRTCYILWSIVDSRQNVYKISKEKVEAEHGDLKHFNTAIPRRTAVAESSLVFEPVCIYDANNKASKDFKKLAKEIVEVADV